MSEPLKRYYVCRFNRKSGKIDTTMSGLGKGLIQVWALENTCKKSDDTVIFDEDGIIHSYYEGTGDFPKVTKHDQFLEEMGFDHIDKLCEGLLDYCKKGE